MPLPCTLLRSLPVQGKIVWIREDARGNPLLKIFIDIAQWMWIRCANPSKVRENTAGSAARESGFSCVKPLSIDRNRLRFIDLRLMISLVKRVLVVAHNAPLRTSRVLLLQSNGYYVESVGADDEAMELLENEQFDLILIGRKSQLLIKGIDQRLREKYPNLLTLKIEALGEIESIYPSRMTDAVPEHVIAALKEMLTS
jgi:hypothetical protein